MGQLDECCSIKGSFNSFTDKEILLLFQSKRSSAENSNESASCHKYLIQPKAALYQEA